MDGEAVRIVREGVEQQVERGAMLAGGHVVARERQPSPPVLRVPGDDALAQLGEAARRARRAIRAFETFEREIGAVGRHLDEALPRLDGRRQIALPLVDVAKVQIGGAVPLSTSIASRKARAAAAGSPARTCTRPISVRRKPRICWFSALRAPSIFAICSRTCSASSPLVLLLVQLLQVHERVAVLRVEVDDFLKRLERAVDEPAVPEIEPEAEQHVGVFELA